MNVVFLSPNFPLYFWNFCDRLKEKGVNVLDIGDASYESLAPECKQSLTAYYQVGSLEKGKLADICAWKCDPAEDVKTMTDCQFVMKEGQVICRK